MAINTLTGNTLLESGSFPPARVASTGSPLSPSTGGLLVVDGIQLVAGDRVLCKDETSAVNNGIYAANTGPWVRTNDATTNQQFFSGMMVVVALGTLNRGQLFLCTCTDDPVVVGTSLITFASVQSIQSSTGGPANPTGTVGLTAVNGSALTVMRSDAAPPLNQAIIPTWTGLHTFDVGPAIAIASLALGATISVGGTNVYSAPTQSTISAALAIGASLNDSTSGNLFQFSSWVDNTGTKNTVAVFGQGRAQGTSSRAWGGNFVGYTGAAGAFAQAVEIDFGVSNGVSFQKAWGLSINAGGNTFGSASNEAVGIAFDQLSSVGQMIDAIRFNNTAAGQPYTNSLLKTTGTITPTFGIDFSSAAFATAAIKTKGFLLDPNGLLSSGTNGGTGGQLTLKGSTSGSAVLSVAATLGTLGLASAMAIAPTLASNTSGDGLILNDTTTASAANQQFSPRLRLTGQGWKTTATAASQAVDWIIENQPVQGTTNPSSNLVISSQINAGGYTALSSLSSAGVLTLGAAGAGGQVTLKGGTSGSAVLSVGASNSLLQLGSANITADNTGIFTTVNAFAQNVAVSALTGLGGSVSASTLVLIGPATTAVSEMRLTVGGPPTSPVDGDIWFESNINTGLKIRINGNTKTFTVA